MLKHLTHQSPHFGRMHFSDIKPGNVVFTDKMPAPFKSHILHAGLKYSNTTTEKADQINVNLVVYNSTSYNGGGQHRAETFRIDDDGFVDGISEHNPARPVSKRGMLRRLLEFFGAPKTVLIDKHKARKK